MMDNQIKSTLYCALLIAFRLAFTVHDPMLHGKAAREYAV